MTDTAIQRAQPSAMENRQVPSTAELIQLVVQSGGDAMEKAQVLKELISLRQSEERFQWEREERQAKIDFDQALNDCQSKIGRIAPNAKRENGITWADYAHIDRTIRPIYTEAGFSISFSEEPSEGARLRQKATLSRGGVSREYFGSISTVPASGKMNAMDAEASAASRLQRYLMIKIFNIAIGIDEDEKKPYEPNMEGFEDYLANIEAASDEDELKAAYIAAAKAAKNSFDEPASIEFEKAKNKCLAKIREGA